MTSLHFSKLHSAGARDFDAEPGAWIMGSVGVGHDGSLEVLRERVGQVEAAGCDAIKIPHYHAGALFADLSYRRSLNVAIETRHSAGLKQWPEELKLEELQRLADECVGRLGLVVAVFDLSALADVSRLDSKGTMLSIEAPVATNPFLVEGVAESGHPALVEVNLLSPEQITAMCQRFAPGLLTLVWRHRLTRPSPTHTVEDLFALVRLKQYGRSVGYAGSSGDSMAALVAAGFGATVIEEALSPTSDLAHLVSLIRRSQATPARLEAETLSPAELDAMDEIRPSLIAARSIVKGETITAEMLACKAPFRGLSPNLLPLVVGKRALYHIGQEEPITFGMIDL